LAVLLVDGLSHDALGAAMVAGQLPHLVALTGAQAPLALADEYPVNPVATWTSIITGVAPTVHGVFGESMPGEVRGTLLSARSASPAKEGVTLTSARAVVPFWDRIAEAGGRVSALYVPWSAPLARKSYARVVAGHSFPGVRGGPARYHYFAEEEPKDFDAAELGVEFAALERSGDSAWSADLAAQTGEEAPFVAAVGIERSGAKVQVRVDGQSYRVPEGGHSAWIDLTLERGRDDLAARTRFHVLSINPPRLLFEPLGPRDSGSATFYALPPELPESLSGRAGRRGTAFDWLALPRLVAAGLVSRAMAQTMLEDDLRSWADTVVAELDASSSKVVLAAWNAMPAALALAEGDSSWSVMPAFDAAIGRVALALGDDGALALMGVAPGAMTSKEVDFNAWLVSRGHQRLAEDGTIDWEQSKAVALGGGRIQLLPPPEAQERGGKAERFLKRITRELKGARFQGRVVDEVLLGDELFSGDLRSRAPDLLVLMSSGVADASAPRAVASSFGRALAEARYSWSAVAPKSARGFLLCSSKLLESDPKPSDLAATVAAYTRANVPGLAGRVLFKGGVASAEPKNE
jgi:hypothetical protein